MTSLTITLWLAAIALTDLRTMRIPNMLIWPGMCAVTAYGAADHRVGVAALLAAAPYAVCHSLGWCGGGDVKLALVCGGLLTTWDAALMLVLCAALGNAALFGLLHGRTVLPHGPVLVAVTVALGGLLHA